MMRSLMSAMSSAAVNGTPGFRVYFRVNPLTKERNTRLSLISPEPRSIPRNADLTM